MSRRAVGPHIVMALCLAALSTGCGTGWWLRGTVRQTSACAVEPAAPTPVPGAVARVTCPDGRALTAVADADGRIALPLDAALPMACTVHVEAAGHGPWSIDLVDACAWPEGGACRAASITARLRPAAGEAP